MHALVVSFDRLPVQFLSCYGNSWIETPHFDRLAARAVTFDQHFVRFVDPADARGALAGSEFFAAGIPATLFREQGADRTAGPAIDEGHTHECSGEEGLDAQPKRTSVAATVDGALESLYQAATGERPSLTWVQLRGVPTPWLAPRDYATLYLDLVEDDAGEPQPGNSTSAAPDDESEPDFDDLEIDEEEEHPPEPETELKLIDFSPEEFDAFLKVRSSFPADEAARRALSAADRRIIRSLYGGYVTLLDRELGRLLDAVDQFPDDQPLLVIVTAARGEQLDDVTKLRGSAARLCDDIVHTPHLIWERSRGDDIGSRRQCLVQTTDLEPTLRAWFGLAAGKPAGEELLSVVRNQRNTVRDELWIDAPGASALRTPEHYLVAATPPGQGDETVHLFWKPEDVWDVNDVAAQAPELVESLLERLKRPTEPAPAARQ